MITGKNYSRVFIKRLFLDPVYKLTDTGTGAVNHHTVVVISVLLFITLVTFVAVLEVGGNSQHTEVERFVILGNLRQFIFCILKQFGIFIAPPLVVAFRDQSLADRPVVIVNFIITVRSEVILPSAECGIGTQHKVLFVAASLRTSPSVESCGKKLS